MSLENFFDVLIQGKDIRHRGEEEKIKEEEMKTRKVLSMLGVTLLLFGANIAVTQAAQVLLPGTLIPKFVDPLPEAGAISVVDATSTGTPSYTIHMREFQSQILPSTGVPPTIPPNTPSWVWGYLTDADVAAGGVRPSYLGPVVVAERGVPVSPTYLNELPVPAGNVQNLLPIDMTLDWANPGGLNCLPDTFGNYTNPACGVLPYSGLIPDSVHIHGGEVEPAYDGGPDAWFTQPNQLGSTTGIGYLSNTYQYPNGQEEATIWFHPHGFGITRLNVFAGLAGVYPIIDPANPPLAAMPAFPQHDIPLIIQDRSFDTTGQIFYNLASNPQPNPTVHPFWIPEFIGDAIVVNGKTWPYLNVEPRQYRFRLLNGSNARFYDLTLLQNKPNNLKPTKVKQQLQLPFIAIATDDGYLVNAVSTPNVIIAPGERYEVIVDFSALPVGTSVVMMNSARTPFPGGGAPIKGVTDTVMQFRVVANTSGLPTVPPIVAGTPIRPTPLHPILNNHVAPALPPAAPAGNIVRQLTLNEVIGAGGPA